MPVVNENGIQRGNYHLPVGIYTGNIDFEGANYHGARDGKYTILQKGDENAEPKTYQADQLQTALQQTAPDNAIVVEINHETEKRNALAPTVEESLSMDVDKELNLDINASALNDEHSQLTDISDDGKIMETEELSLPAEENLSVDETDSDKEAKRLDNDEVNILHHEEKQKIKEKEYGD